MTAVRLKEQKRGQREAADAGIGPPFQRRILHQASAGRQVHPVRGGRPVAGGLENLLWQEKRAGQSVCNQRCDGSVKRVKLLSVGFSCGWTKQRREG